MSEERLAIVGIFYDGYEDVWRDFVRCFRRFWKDCPYHVYIIDITATPKYFSDNNMTVINAGEGAEYSKKVQMALQQIDAKYYLLLLEDFFLGHELERSVLEPVLDYIEDKNIKYYSLSALSSFTAYHSTLFDKSKEYLYNINPNLRYTLGCQAVIWRKDFLQNCIGTRNYNAWVFEGALTNSKKVHTKRFLQGCVKDTRNILGLKHGVLQSKLLPRTVDYYKGIKFPLTTTRTVMSESDFKKYVMRSRISAVIPKALHSLLKKITSKGAVLDKFSDEIRIVIKENFGE
ncbi:MAG: hypothetical protein K6F97_12700 [Lachnospiraceae bacterium]|nr:hypothetical protein [Lachnospiraceae bacterium]